MADASSSSYPPSSHLLTAATLVKRILDSANAEGAHCFSSQGHDKEEKERAEEGRRDEKEKAIAEKSAQQHAPEMQIRISRRPGRPPRKREWRSHRADVLIECPSNRKDLLRLASAGLHGASFTTAAPAAAATAATATVAPKSGTDSRTLGGSEAPRSSSSPEIDQESTLLPRKEKAEEMLSFIWHQGTRQDVAHDGGGGTGGKERSGKRDGVPRPFASRGSSWHAHQRQHWKRRQRQQQAPISILLPKSTTRVISSETYLRRLFVTASLAHVLSLDECLPRTMPSMRVISWRVAGRGDGGDGGSGGGGSFGGNGREEGRWTREEGGDRGEVMWRGMNGGAGTGNEGNERNIVGGIHNAQSIANVSSSSGGIAADINNDVNSDNICSNSSDTRNNPFITTTTAIATTPAADNDSSTFKKYYPVTLIDNAGHRWHVTYVTTRRDNLHSGRLVDGWETFCYENELRIGDVVEFTRVEANEQPLPGDRREKEAVARVFACKKRYRQH